jgi:hypothetical protein
MKWFLGRGPRPQYGRWTYWEKFDYFAVFWGVAVIGGTGMMLWFPSIFTRVLPGWMVNVATTIHSDEALLAVSFIFVVHFFQHPLPAGKVPHRHRDLHRRHAARRVQARPAAGIPGDGGAPANWKQNLMPAPARYRWRRSSGDAWGSPRSESGHADDRADHLRHGLRVPVAAGWPASSGTRSTRR